MQYMVIGMFGKYADAEAAVLDLESAGIVGEQVEVISDIDEDVRTANTPGEPSTKPREPRGAIARLFGAGGPLAKPEVRDVSGEQPNYIGEQEFYANHLKQGGAVMIVRTSSEPSATRAAAIMHSHDGHTPGAKSSPVVRPVD
ncbi:MAG: hypothetical protein ABSF78_08280 [Candidatus Acidiferrales bacterium]|jgi:hypothetical protein